MSMCAVVTQSENPDDVDPGAFVVMIIALGIGILFTIKNKVLVEYRRKEESGYYARIM